MRLCGFQKKLDLRAARAVLGWQAADRLQDGVAATFLLAAVQRLHALGDVLGRPTFLPIPKFGPKLVLGGELADNLLFSGQTGRGAEDCTSTVDASTASCITSTRQHSESTVVC